MHPRELIARGRWRGSCASSTRRSRRASLRHSCRFVEHTRCLVHLYVRYCTEQCLCPLTSGRNKLNELSYPLVHRRGEPCAPRLRPRELSRVASSNRCLLRLIVSVDPHPPRPQERLGFAFQHLNCAVGCDVQVEHVHPADAGRNTQAHALLASALLAARCFRPHPVKFEDPGV